jgi:ketosteroid isomerase-like protein
MMKFLFLNFSALLISVIVPASDATENKESPDEISKTIIGMENAALTLGMKGDVGAFLEISAKDVVYFDPFIQIRLDGWDALKAYYGQISGQEIVDRFELLNPLVQVNGDMAVLTFNFTSQTGDKTSRWNCTEVFRRDKGQWRIIQTHWSFTKPDLSSLKAVTTDSPMSVGAPASGDETSKTIIALEKAALSRWLNGDPDGFLDVSAKDVVYFDPTLSARLDGWETLKSHYDNVRGKIFAERFELLNPLVQISGDMAVLTYNYVSHSAGKSRAWNCTEVYRRDNGQWRIIQTHWSLTRPGF